MFVLMENNSRGPKYSNLIKGISAFCERVSPDTLGDRKSRFHVRDGERQRERQRERRRERKRESMKETIEYRSFDRRATS